MGLHFSKEEFRVRKSKVLDSMKDQNIDALLMFRQESMYWLTGYDTFGYVFFQTLVLDQKENLILLTRVPDQRHRRSTESNCSWAACPTMLLRMTSERPSPYMES